MEDSYLLQRKIESHDRVIHCLVEELSSLQRTVGAIDISSLCKRVKSLEEDSQRKRMEEWHRTQEKAQLHSRDDIDRVAYHDFRVRVTERDKNTCQDCGQVGGVLIIHHILMWAHHPHLRYTLDNGVLLCGSCHDRRHTARHWKREDFDPSLPISKPPLDLETL